MCWLASNEICRFYFTIDGVNSDFLYKNLHVMMAAVPDLAAIGIQC